MGSETASYQYFHIDLLRGSIGVDVNGYLFIMNDHEIREFGASLRSVMSGRLDVL